MTSIEDSGFNLSPDDVLNMLVTVRSFLDEVPRLFNQYDNQPAAESPATREKNSFTDSDLIIDVCSRGLLSMEAAADHLMVFTDSVTEPAKTVAPWTCVRGLLESSALAAWFLDPTIDAKTRVGRCFAFRHEGFIQQIKFFRAANMLDHIRIVEQRIAEVEQDALGLGYSRRLNKDGKMTGIAQHMPNIVELVGQTLDREIEYRLLSAIAHGHHWAIQQVSFRVIESETAENGVEKAFQKHLHPTAALYLANIAIMAFTRVLWYIWRFYGWNLGEIEQLLEQTYNQLKYKRETRFWHPTAKAQTYR